MKRKLRYSYCHQHRKRRYHSRKDARRATRIWRASGPMREYPCTLAAGCWHVGHLPQATALGLLTRDEVYRGVKVNLTKPDKTLTLWYVPGPGNPVRPHEGEPFEVAWFTRTQMGLDFARLDATSKDGNDGVISIPWHQIATVRFGPEAPWSAYPYDETGV